MVSFCSLIFRSASLVLLSALAAPIVTTAKNEMEFDESRVRTARLTALIHMSQAPTRSSLIQDAVTNSLLLNVVHLF
jgi:hypothetical protein